MSENSDIQRIQICHASDLIAFLESHPNGPSVWLVTWKAAHKDKYVSRDEILDALVAYGWIDSRRMKLDDDRTMQLIAPRQTDVWARSYKVRADRLMGEGRMQPQGLAAIERAKDAGLWTVSDPIDDLHIPEDLRDALEASGGANWFDGAAPSYRRNVLRFLVSAKRAATREKRVALIAGHAARGEKVPQY